MIPRVENNPYQAEAEWLWKERGTDGEAVARNGHSVVARDSRGRVLRQYELAAIIYDPVLEALHFVDLKAGTTLMSLPLTSDPFTWGPVIEVRGMSVPIGQWVAQEGDTLLGEQIIEGMTRNGHRRELGAKAIEFWIAEELQETVLARILAERVDLTFRLYNIRREEPDPRLLMVFPQDPRDVVEEFIFRPL
jgi:hypothetical protein